MNTQAPRFALLIQGRLRANSRPFYEQYLKGTGPLMTRHQVGIGAVGGPWSGLAGKSIKHWEVNAILLLPEATAATQFLMDPDYLQLKQQFRDQAFSELYLHSLPLLSPWQPLDHDHVVACGFSQEPLREWGQAKCVAKDTATTPEGGPPLGKQLTIFDLGPCAEATPIAELLLVEAARHSNQAMEWHFFKTRAPRTTTASTSQGDEP